MKVKVALSPEARVKFESNQFFDMPGMWSIYWKRHWWNKWRVYGNCGFADKNMAIAYAREIADLEVIVK